MTKDTRALVDGLSLESFGEFHRPGVIVTDSSDHGRLIDQKRNEIAYSLNKENVRRALRRAGTSGATTSEISQVTGLNSQAARKILEELCATREAYRLKRNRTTTIYYNNGRPRHEFGMERIEDGNTTFEIYLAEGPDDSLLVNILEKKFTLLEGEQIEGGVIIPAAQIPAIIQTLEKFHTMAIGDSRGTR